MAAGITPAQASFAAGVLKGVGAPVTPQTVAGFVGWAKAEGGDNWQRNNPLNTTESAGSTGSINSVGVKVYPNAQTGVAATVRTLNNGRYGGILGALRSGNVHGLAAAIGASPWGTSGSLAAQTIAQTLGQPVPAQLPAISGGASNPGPVGSVSVPVTTQGFDQAGFKDAMGRFIAGQFVKAQGGASNPYSGSAGAGKGFAAGLNVSNPLLASGQLTTVAPNAQDFVTSQTHMQQVATGQLQQLAGGSLVNVHAGAKGDVNPIAGAVIGRTDMGVDANLKPGAPIVAPNAGRVVAITPDWYKGQPYVAVQLTAGPNAGKVMYVAEQVAPSVRVGQTLARGAVIGRYAPSGTGIEIGWANPRNPTQTLAQGTTGYTEGQQTKAGTNFRSYLGSLG